LVLAFSVIIFHSALSWHRFLHRLIPIICVSSSISAIHHFFDLPLIPVPVGFRSSIRLGVFLSSIEFAVYPVQLSQKTVVGSLLADTAYLAVHSGGGSKVFCFYPFLFQNALSTDFVSRKKSTQTKKRRRIC
jgi:hypothetical protein